ncbi:fimbrial protein [Photorhabdus heterorhabditis]|uniref:Type 1 fimbrial protein n=1 Tax=Photorhabdus heterorhabditis TaxID=880156 RepID=A0A5B0X9X5_9GAMM|nr:fimbrial protein [Photorhabdus heterorhabditis]KAA1195151.1 type 1 fimbrial protein [Photorhabdus heterorhabditis]
MFGTVTGQEKNRLNDPLACLTKGRYAVMRCFCCSILVLLFLAVSGVAEGHYETKTSGVDVEFQATIIPDPCDMEISSGGTLDFGSLSAASFAKLGDILSPHKLQLKLTNCGYPNANTGSDPEIFVEGTTINNGRTMFRDSDGPDSSEGLGFVLMYSVSDDGDDEIDWDDLIIAGRGVSLNNDLSIEIEDQQAEVPIVVAIAREPQGDGVIRPGQLHASVTFTFTYR